MAGAVVEREIWKPIPGMEGYEASNQGRIRSWRSGRARVLNPAVAPCGFRTLQPMKDGRPTPCRVGTLVVAAFLAPRPAGAEVRRLNGDPLDDRLENLAYGTKAEVLADHAARARREDGDGPPPNCPECGDVLKNNWLGNFGERRCSTCCTRRAYRARDRVNRPQQYAKKLAQYRRWREQHKDELNARARAARVPAPPRTADCIDCGEALPPKTGTGPVRLRCDPCKRSAAREADRRHYWKQKAAA